MKLTILIAVLALAPAAAQARPHAPQGPVIETCAFLPASDPCHNPPPPPPPVLCFDERGLLALCEPF